MVWKLFCDGKEFCEISDLKFIKREQASQNLGLTYPSKVLFNIKKDLSFSSFKESHIENGNNKKIDIVIEKIDNLSVTAWVQPQSGIGGRS